MEEVWKIFKTVSANGSSRYFTNYEVSNFGRIRKVTRSNVKYYDLKPNHTGRIRFNHDYVHRLVAIAFIPNPNNLPCINHKDCDPTNNCMDNLEWCDWKYNNNYADHNAKIAKALTGKHLSKDHKRKISATRKGKPLSEEHRAKLSASMKARHNRLANEKEHTMKK